MGHTYVGVVVRWTAGGYGFAFNDEVNRRVFFHIRNWNSVREPVVGDEVTFELGPSHKPGGADEAVNVTPTGLNAFAVKAGV